MFRKMFEVLEPEAFSSVVSLDFGVFICRRGRTVGFLSVSEVIYSSAILLRLGDGDAVTLAGESAESRLKIEELGPIPLREVLGVAAACPFEVISLFDTGCTCF
jgi:tRNA(Ile2) C34 agmatinyltransferase TiaS